MAIKVNSYVHFNGNAREALKFYHSVFGGEVQMNTFADYASDEMPVSEEDKDKIMHASLRGTGGIELMLSDTPSMMEYQEGSRISLAFNSDSETEGRAYWDKLTEGGTITMPLVKSMWNSTFGMFTDKFGVNWMINIGQM